MKEDSMNQFYAKTLLHENYNTIKTRLLEVTEELKMRRKNDQENGLKFNKLITEKFEIKRQKDEEIANLTKAIDDLKQENLQLNKEFEEKMKMHEEDKAAQVISINSSSKGIKSLKEEILALQLTKYGLEKKIKEQEHQLQMGMKAKEDISIKMTSLQKIVESLQEQHNNMRTRLGYLADLVVKTEEMQKKLVQVNEHHRCVITNCQSTLNQSQKELTATKAHVVLLSSRNADVTPTNMLSDDGQIRELKALCQQLESDVTSVREQKKFFMSSLNESNGILSNLQSKFDDLYKKHVTCQSEIDYKCTEIERIQTELRTKNKTIEALKQNLETREEETINQECEFSNQIQSVQENLSVLRSSLQSIEVENRHFREQHNYFNDQIHRLRMTSLQKNEQNSPTDGKDVQSHLEATSSSTEVSGDCQSYVALKNNCSQSDLMLLSRENKIWPINGGEKTVEKNDADLTALLLKPSSVYNDSELSNCTENEPYLGNCFIVMLSSNREQKTTSDGEHKLVEIDDINDYTTTVNLREVEVEDSVSYMEE